MFGAFVVRMWANENGVRNGAVNGKQSCCQPCIRCLERESRIAQALDCALRRMGR